MKVEILATTELWSATLEDAYDYRTDNVGGVWTEATDADALGEAAGRICYQSWGRKNPATAHNAGYLANILDHGHFSVLEHASVTFLVRGVSRALLAELTRHRHLSYSVVSQRYVDHSGTEPVIPPAAEGDVYAETTIRDAYALMTCAYERLAAHFEREGMKRKQAREAARSVLPNAAPVDMIVTGNLRAWRDVLGKRHSKHADAEIQRFAQAILGHLRSVAPNSMQDIAESPGE